jgi:gallate dioxygenase
LSDQEKQMIRSRDWRSMVQYGASFFLLEKMAAVVGTSNPHVYAHMRGQTLDDFQKTRTHKVLYSVAGKDSGKLAWEKDQPTAPAAK